MQQQQGEVDAVVAAVRSACIGGTVQKYGPAKQFGSAVWQYIDRAVRMAQQQLQQQQVVAGVPAECSMQHMHWQSIGSTDEQYIGRALRISQQQQQQQQHSVIAARYSPQALVAAQYSPQALVGSTLLKSGTYSFHTTVPQQQQQQQYSSATQSATMPARSLAPAQQGRRRRSSRGA